MNALAGLMNPAQIGADVQNAFQSGREMVKQQQTESALSAYAANPNDDAAFQQVAKYAPKFAIQIGEDRRKRQQEQQIAGLRTAAAQGDQKALIQLWGVDADTAKNLSDVQVKEAVGGFKFIADAAYEIVKRPPAQRAQAWDEYIQRGVEMGYDGLGTYKGQYSEQNLNSVVAKAGQMKEFQEFQQPKYSPVGENGMQGFQYGVPMANGAIAPQAGGPKPGDTEDGYTFKGGDPSNPSNWVQGGGVGNGTGGFQPTGN